MSEPPVCVGIDISKAQLEVALRPTTDGWPVSHDEVGIIGMVERLQAVQPTLVVLEATGGWRCWGPGPWPRPVCPWSWCIPVMPGMLPQPPAAWRKRTRSLPEAQAQAVSPLLTRQRPWGQRRTADRRQLQTAPRPIQAALQAPITGLTRRVARTDADLAAALQASPPGRATDAIIQSTPGVGPRLARTLVAEVPEVGVLNRQASAGLIGVASFNRESGTLRGTRAVWGGRAHVRAVRCRSPWAAVRHHAVLTAFYARLRAVGKAPTVALTACRRTLLTILHARRKHRTPGHEHDATRA